MLLYQRSSCKYQYQTKIATIVNLMQLAIWPNSSTGRTWWGCTGSENKIIFNMFQIKAERGYAEQNRRDAYNWGSDVMNLEPGISIDLELAYFSLAMSMRFNLENDLMRRLGSLLGHWTRRWTYFYNASLCWTRKNLLNLEIICWTRKDRWCVQVCEVKECRIADGFTIAVRVFCWFPFVGF